MWFKNFFKIWMENFFEYMGGLKIEYRWCYYMTLFEKFFWARGWRYYMALFEKFFEHMGSKKLNIWEVLLYGTIGEFV